jgi:hypothetical protein
VKFKDYKYGEFKKSIKMKKTIILIILFGILASTIFPFLTVGEKIDDSNNFGNSLYIHS